VSLVRQIWRYMRVRKKFWLLPIFASLCAFGGLMILSKGSTVAPFLYAIF
jgi:hypothetical protein